MASSSQTIDRASEIVPDARWVDRREVFEVLYSYPEAVPFVHQSCAERRKPAQYLQRCEAGIRCPSCGRSVAPRVIEALGIEPSPASSSA